MRFADILYLLAGAQFVSLALSLGVTYFSESNYEGNSLHAEALDNNCTEIPKSFGPAKSIKFDKPSLCFLLDEAECEGDGETIANGDVANIDPPAVSMFCATWGVDRLRRRMRQKVHDRIVRRQDQKNRFDVPEWL